MLGIHQGNLRICEHNQDQFKDIKAVTGYVYIHASCTLDSLIRVDKYLVIVNDSEDLIKVNLPSLESTGRSFSLQGLSKVNAPRLKEVGIDLRIESECTLPSLVLVQGNIRAYKNCVLPSLVLVEGSIRIYDGAEVIAPELVTVNKTLYIPDEGEIIAPKIKSHNLALTIPIKTTKQRR